MEEDVLVDIKSKDKEFYLIKSRDEDGRDSVAFQVIISITCKVRAYARMGSIKTNQISELHNLVTKDVDLLQ